MHKRKILLNFFALGSLLASLALSLNLLGTGTQHTFAQSSGVSATDFYINSGQEPWGTTFDSKGNVWVAVPGCDPSPTCSPTTPPGKIEEYNPTASSWIATYQLPAGYTQPLFLAFDAQGNLWFPMPTSNAIGMLNPASNTFQQIAVPTPGAGPWDIAIDQAGKIWFTEHYSNKVGELDPSTQTITEISTPASNSQPYGIVVDGSNNIWFTENNSALAQIGEYTTGGTLNEYKIRTSPPSGLTPHLITVDPSGNIWWTEGFVGMIGELRPSLAEPGTNAGVFEYAYPATCCNGTHTSGIGVDSSGQVWFDDSLQSIFGSFPDTGTGSFSVHATPTSNSHPHDGLNVDGHNRIWFTEEFANKFAVAVQNAAPTPTPSPSVTLTPPPSPTVGTVLAQDSFVRPNQTRWGTASDGQTWGADTNTARTFSIVNNVGKISKGNGTYNAILGPTATDAEVLFHGSISSYTNSYLGAVVRWSNTNNWYKATLNGTSLSIQKRVHGSTTTLKSAHFAPKVATSYSLRFRVVGTTLYAKVWQTGTAEPSSWLLTIKDIALSSGFCGLSTRVATGVIARYTSFGATIP